MQSSYTSRPVLPLAQTAGARSMRKVAFAATPLVQSHNSLPSRRHPIAAASSEAQAEQQDIENLNKDYCDDFVCTSSPAIESTVRALARDIQRANGVWTRSLFSNQKLEYKGFRRFKGYDGYKTLNFVPAYVQSPTVTISKMRMIDTGNAEITWRLQGSVGPTPVDVDVTTRISMNLLTGQIEQHNDSWDLKRCSPPAALAWTTALATYGFKTGSAAAVETTNSILDSLTSMDEDEQTFTPNPNDPMKFFQQKDTFKDDAVFFVGIMMLFYFMAQAWGNLFKG